MVLSHNSTQPSEGIYSFSRKLNPFVWLKAINPPPKHIVTAPRYQVNGTISPKKNTPMQPFLTTMVMAYILYIYIFQLTVSTKLTQVTTAVTESDEELFSRAETKVVIISVLHKIIVPNKLTLRTYSA